MGIPAFLARRIGRPRGAELCDVRPQHRLAFRSDECPGIDGWRHDAPQINPVLPSGARPPAAGAVAFSVGRDDTNAMPDSSLPQIAPQELAERLDRGEPVQVLDVRTPDKVQ